MNSHWSDYWEQGHLTSFGDSFTDNYTGILKDVWEPIFTGLPSDSKFLDIATGNGALTLLASVYLENTGIEVEGIGIDLAKISTDISELKIADNLSLFFKSGVDCTHLPFNDNEFDLVVSQFGIEYSNLDIAIPEALRVLKKKGYLSLVVHHEHSMIILRNSKILAFLNDPRISLFLKVCWV
ncbi:class I SAM-dependent methyltransferase [Shewanella woodyi]|uniref:class I SAM-dependent methyltransferase n=1 Tax=Shewanella woodyi TaxID=60961 RepID=UPI00374802C9